MFGDRVDGGNRERDQAFFDGFVKTQENPRSACICGHHSPSSGERCAGEGERRLSRKGGLPRGFADSPFGVMRDRVPPGPIAKVEIDEQKRSRRRLMSARWGARQKFPLHGADQRERLFGPAARGLCLKLKDAPIEILHRR